MIKETMSNIQPEYKFILPTYASNKTLGRYSRELNWKTFEQRFIFYIGVKRIIKYCKIKKELGWTITFDQVFSHVVSHEYLHHILTTLIKEDDDNEFDNLFGELHHNPMYVYSGITFDGTIPKRHFYTKLINTIKNKIGMVK